jgi:hypothetical protein
MYVCLVIVSLSYLSVDMFETFLPVALLSQKDGVGFWYLQNIVFVFLRVVLRAYLVLLLIADLSVCTTPGLLYNYLNLLLVACRVLCCVGQFLFAEFAKFSTREQFP